MVLYALSVMTCASGSAVEHLLAKEGVAGSIPVSRSFCAKKQVLEGFAFRHLFFFALLVHINIRLNNLKCLFGAIAVYVDTHIVIAAVIPLLSGVVLLESTSFVIDFF